MRRSAFRIRTWVLPVLLMISFFSLAGCRDGGGSGPDTLAVRPFETTAYGRWVGNAVCYGPHRDGQRPGGPSPSADELLEDLKLMLPHWNLMRIYSSSDFAGTLLSVIRENDMEMKVVLGVWIDPEEKRDSTGVVVESYPDARADNAREAEAAIRLAEAYPEIVTAICVGNETQIYWSAHRSPLDILVGYVRRVREGAVVPVTAADDFNYWNKPESRKLAAEIDFIMLHAHPMWNGIQLEDALGWLKEQLAAVQQMHPGRDVIIGETGWATSVGSEGEQSVLIKGKPGEAEQRRFYIDLRAWADSARQPVFYFEAFDENWKGGDDPAEVEKHWGLFRADRTPKAAMR